ncbi:GTPase RhebL1 [Larus michahellis]|uniref:GTPase RhebL1 n=1 Tax=Larus michahellis TaxID=119627 RepID=UPI003D9BF00E
MRGSAQGRATPRVPRPPVPPVLPPHHPTPPHSAAAWAVPPVRHRKVLILGYRAVGQTSLAHQFVEGKFVECYEPTVESTYNKDEFQLQLVGTAGQEEYAILPHSFVIGVHGYVLVYSVTSLRSFQVVKTLHKKLYESWGKTRLPVVLVGNKGDLCLQRREVRTDEGKKLAESWGAVFLESSAKESQVTQEIFMKITKEMDWVDSSYSRSTGCRLM